MTVLRHIFALLLCSTTALGLRAHEARVAYSDSVEIRFRQSKWNLDPTLDGNGQALDSIHRRLTYIQGDSIYRISQVSVTGAASPEGSEVFNKFLSEKRAETLFNHLKDYVKLSNAERRYEYRGRDWHRLLDLAEKDPDLPYREEVLSLIRTIAEEKGFTGKEPDNSLGRLKQLRGGLPYSYLYRNIFPAVRASRLVFDYSARLSPAVAAAGIENLIACHIDSVASIKSILPGIHSLDSVLFSTSSLSSASPFYMAVRSNMLYDALLLPNIGVDFYLGKGFTFGVNWLYGWWSCDSKHWFWRAYGGEINMRWYPWRRNDGGTPFAGHHFGLLGQVYIYDFEMGKNGEMGGTPGRNIFHGPFWSAGVEYGYTIPVGTRLSLDFSLGIGYATGRCHTYNPRDTHYVWESTRRRRYIGPTKAEIALVWLIGEGNINRKRVTFRGNMPEEEGGEK